MAFTDPIYMVWSLIEEHLSVIHTSHVPLVCVPCEPRASAQPIYKSPNKNKTDPASSLAIFLNHTLAWAKLFEGHPVAWLAMHTELNHTLFSNQIGIKVGTHTHHTI